MYVTTLKINFVQNSCPCYPQVNAYSVRKPSA